MFTGLIETTALVQSVEKTGNGLRIQLTPEKELDGIKIGDSLCTDGVCLTAERIDGGRVIAFAITETLQRSTLRFLRQGSRVNLERALRVGDRLDGHWVSGHVDCVGSILSDERKGHSIERWVRVESRYMGHIAEKGSVAIDGISLTVARRAAHGFCVALIPHTLENTAFGKKVPGDSVNIETDILAKYAESRAAQDEQPLTFEKIKMMGY